MALTEVLKIVAEDRASHVIDAVANRAQYQFGASAQAAQRFAKGLSGYVTESIVGFAKAAVFGMAAFGAASVAALGAFGASAVKAEIDAQRLMGTMTGMRSPVVAAVDDMTSAWTRLQRSVGAALIDATKLKTVASGAAIVLRGGGSGPLGSSTPSEVAAQDRISKAKESVGSGPIDVMVRQFERLVEIKRKSNELDDKDFQTLNAGGLLKFLREQERLIQLKARAQRDAEYAEVQYADAGKSRAKQTITDILAERAAREKAIEEEIRLQEKLDQAVQRMREKFEQIEIKKIQNQIARDDMIAKEQDRQRQSIFDMKEDQGRRNQQAEDDKARKAKEAANEQEQAASRLADVYGRVGSAAGSFLSKIIQGGMSATDVMLSLLSTAIQVGASFLLPGAGAAASGIFGFLGSLFNEGGVARAANGMRVPGVGSGDRVPALLERGEVVIPNGASHPSFLQEVAMAAGGGGGNTTVNLSQSYLVPPDSVTAQRTYQKGLVPVLQDLHSTGRGSVTNPRFRGRKAS